MKEVQLQSPDTHLSDCGGETAPNQSVTEIPDLIYASFTKTAANEHTKFLSGVFSFTMEEEKCREPFPFPFDENVVFRESSFFKKPNAPLSLPTPTEVRKVASNSEKP